MKDLLDYLGSVFLVFVGLYLIVSIISAVMPDTTPSYSYSSSKYNSSSYSSSSYSSGSSSSYTKKATPTPKPASKSSTSSNKRRKYMEAIEKEGIKRNGNNCQGKC